MYGSKRGILNPIRRLSIRRATGERVYDLRRVTDASQARLAAVLMSRSTQRWVELDHRDLTPTVYFEYFNPPVTEAAYRLIPTELWAKPALDRILGERGKPGGAAQS